MTLEINIHDYLTEEEIKDECRAAVRQDVHNQLRTESDIQRFLTNSSYHFVWEAVDELCPEDMREIIAAKIPEIVSDLSSFSVFRPKNAWDRDESKGWTILQSVLSESKPLIEKRVCELVQKIDISDIRDFVYEEFENIISNLKKKSDADA